MHKFLKPKNIKERKLQYEEDIRNECQEKFHMSIDELKSVFFSLYNQLPEPERSKAKNNFDIKFLIEYATGIQKTISFAIRFGFKWDETFEGFDYWDTLWEKYRLKR